MDFIREGIVRYHLADWKIGLIIVFAVLCLGGFQWLLAKKTKLWAGLVLPVAALALVLPKVYAVLFHSVVKDRPDYFLAAALVFPAVWLVCVYLGSYYRCRYKNE